MIRPQIQEACIGFVYYKWNEHYMGCVVGVCLFLSVYGCLGPGIFARCLAPEHGRFLFGFLEVGGLSESMTRMVSESS